MARRSGKNSSRDAGSAEGFGMDEVDAFHADKEKVLLDDSYDLSKRRRRRGDEDSGSEEEVMGIDEDSDESDEEEQLGADQGQDDDDEEFFGKKDDELEEDEEEEGGWGTKRDYYGADDIEDEETAKEIEEEAIRQQKKHMEELNMDDYVDEEMEEEWAKSAKEQEFGESEKDKAETEAVSIQDLSKLDQSAQKQYLERVHPEMKPLFKELEKLSPELKRLTAHKDDSEVLNVKFTALSAYLGAISMYVVLLISFLKEDEPFSMKDHPIMESILSSKELWRQASGLVEDEDVEEFSSDEEGMVSASESIEDNVQSRLEQSQDEEDSDEDSEESSEEGSEEESEEEEEEQDLNIDISKPRIIKKVKPVVAEDFAETGMDDVDKEDKKARKRSLRFYTAKIDYEGYKKTNPEYTGDMDLPYKERLYERQQRLIEEARKRGQHDENGADLDDNDSFDEEDARTAKSINNEFDDSYYQQVKSSKLDQKSKRKSAHESAVKAAKEGKLRELKEEIDEDGKRAINYQILKNKGLTPNRKKDNRNSRVKKRKKYEKAQKKLKSVRAVYTAPTGAYGGEQTGIKKNLSKSVKF